MIPEFIITFREALEAALIVGIILSYLQKTKNTKYNKHVYFGVVAGIVGSIIAALLFISLMGSFEGAAEQIFEGVLMMFAAVLLTTMILWMAKQSHVTRDIEKSVRKKITKGQAVGLMLLVFVSIFREGVETVIFIGASAFTTVGSSLFGTMLGLVAAVLMGYVIFYSARKINLKTFFTITNIVLILFAAGIFAHGVHEFQEASVVPTYVENIWDTNHILNEKSDIGLFAKGLFGYNGNPSALEALSYGLYMLLMAFAFYKIEAIHKVI